MKDKIALWGTDEHDNDILIVIRLRVNDNRVDVWTFPKPGLDVPLADAMIQDWDKIDPDNLPQPNTHIEQDMAQPSLLPDHIRTKNTEVISRTEKEWFVRVLSTKLRAKLNAEIEQLQAQTETLSDYDKETWDLAQSYWTKVNLHFQSRDLNREDTSILRDRINLCFAKLKSLRKEDNSKYDQEAKINATAIIAELERLNAQIGNRHANLNEVFENLKKLQERTLQARLGKDARTELRDKINSAFEIVRNERKNSRQHRFHTRIEGLKDVIAKMEKSAAADENELKFQQSRMNQIGGQLEMQLREAKIQMTKSRLASKIEKLDDMKATLKQVLAEMEREAKRDETTSAKTKPKENKSKESKEKKQQPAKILLEGTNSATETAESGDDEPNNDLATPEISLVSIPTPDNAISELGEEVVEASAKNDYNDDTTT